MKKYSVIQILRTFSIDELNLFEEFIRIPIINKNTKLIHLFNELKPCHPLYTSPELNSEILHKKLSGNSKLKNSYIRNLMSDLNILAEKFIQFSLISKSNTFDRLLIEEFKNRDLNEITYKKLKTFQKKIDKTKSRDQEYYFNNNFIMEMKSFLLVDKTLTDNFRNDQIINTIKLFILTLMENSFYLRVEEQRVKIKHDFEFLKYSLEYIKYHLKEFDDSPLLMIYYHLWSYFIYGSDEDFKEAKKYFKKYFSYLSKIDKKNIYSVMQVYYIDKIDEGNDSYNNEFLNFLLDMTRFNILSHKEINNIGLNLYRNILILCFRQDEIKIMKKFISEYINFVNEESRESILHYSNAHLYFLQGNFEKSMMLCSEIEFNSLLNSTNDNLFFKNDIKSLSLKCLYELNYFENAFSGIDAFKHFLKKSRLIKELTRKKYLKFLNYLFDLIKLKMNFDEYNFLKLKKDFLNEKDLIQKKWISLKIKELEK